MKSLIFSLILIHFANAHANSCRNTISTSSLSFNSVDISEYAFKPRNVRSVDVYTSPSVYASPNSVEIRSRGLDWRSGYSPDQQNIQGDPRNLIILLGDMSALNFGMYMHAENILISPNARKMTEKILAANRFLKKQNQEQIAIRFYDSKTEAPVQRFDYLYATMLNKYPMASDGHFLVHDISVHLGAILLPRIVFDHMNTKTKYFLAFHKELETYSLKIPKTFQEIIRKINEEELKKHEVRVDVTVGNISIVTAERIVGVKKLDHTEELERLVLSPMRRSTTASYIKEWIFALLGQLDRTFYSENRPSDITYDQYFNMSQEIYNIYETFVSKIPQKDQQELQISAQELTSFIDQRRLALSKWDGQ